MGYSDDQLNCIYDRTSGRCHICGKYLSFANYARPGHRGAWEVEHSRPRARGGSSRLTNLYGACISCNREKGTVGSRTARKRYGRTRAPLSAIGCQRKRRQNALAGAVLGAVVGGVVRGGSGAVTGLIIGAAVGSGRDPDPD
jgi:5-methylcytosine-specific restriction endonuclease McrA